VPIPRLEGLPPVEGTVVLVRVDCNVPLADGQVVDDLRLTTTLPTLRWLLDRDARVVTCGHLGRPHGAPDPAASLAPVAARLAELVDIDVPLTPLDAAEPGAVAAVEPGRLILLENLRFDPGETANDPAFVDRLVADCDAYVNEAFGASHRAHASIVGPPPRLPHAAGRLLEAEVAALGGLLADPARPFIAILGGAKVSDKLGVLDALVARCDRVLVGGAMAFTFLVAQGHTVGESLVEPDRVDACRRLLATGRVQIPTDVVAADARRADAATRSISARPSCGLNASSQTTDATLSPIRSSAAPHGQPA